MAEGRTRGGVCGRCYRYLPIGLDAADCPCREEPETPAPAPLLAGYLEAETTAIRVEVAAAAAGLAVELEQLLDGFTETDGSPDGLAAFMGQADAAIAAVANRIIDPQDASNRILAAARALLAEQQPGDMQDTGDAARFRSIARRGGYPIEYFRRLHDARQRAR